MSGNGKSTEGVAAEVAGGRGATAVEGAELFAESSPETTRTRTLVWQDPVPTATEVAARPPPRRT